MRAPLTPVAVIVLLLASPAVPRADPINLLTNGGFETGDFTGWAINLRNQADATYYGVSHGSAHSGSWGAWFGPKQDMIYMSQTVPTTPGHSYLLSAWEANWYNQLPPGTPPPTPNNHLEAARGADSGATRRPRFACADSSDTYCGLRPHRNIGFVAAGSRPVPGLL